MTAASAEGGAGSGDGEGTRTEATSPLAWIADELASLDRDALLRRRRMVVPLRGGECEFEGRRAWNFAGNDYLGLAASPEIGAAVRDAIVRYGTGAQASPLVTGRTILHAELEERLARFEGADAAILFPSGYAANSGTIPALAGQDDVLFCDRLNHASLVDGCRLSGSRLRVYSHRDLAVLERELAKAGEARRRVIVTDSVFSMDGTLAPLREIGELARRYRAVVIVDEAHATGVYGPRGRGVIEHLGLDESAFVRIGTLSKGLGAQGGFVAGSRELVDWLSNKARTQMYSTALAIPAVAAALAALNQLQSGDGLRRRLRENTALLRGGLAAAGFEPLGDPGCPIVPVILGDPDRTLARAQRLEERGFLVGAIRPPTVPRGTSRLRITISASHPPEAVRQLVDAMAQLRDL